MITPGSNVHKRAREGVPIPILLGPTASGKSAVALALAQRVGGEIVNADARCVYRGLDIGTAKPSPGEQKRVRHHLVDICDPDEVYNAQRFREQVARLLPQLLAEHKLPVLVGGSTLYVEALTVGLFEGVGANPGLRKTLDKTPLKTLYGRLQHLDPQTASRLEPHDRVRITRALEVYDQNGTSISCLQRGARPLPYTFRKFGLRLERSQLYARIDRRVERMLAAGLVEEAQQLSTRVRRGTPAYKTIGYRELFAHFEGRCTLDAAVDKIKQHTRNYAKRQLTWYRRYDDVVWLDAEGEDATALAERVALALDAGSRRGER